MLHHYFSRTNLSFSISSVHDSYLNSGSFRTCQNVGPHQAQLVAQKRRRHRQESDEKQGLAFLAYRRKEKQRMATNAAAPPLANTASEVDKESNEKVT